MQDLRPAFFEREGITLGRRKIKERVEGPSVVTFNVPSASDSPVIYLDIKSLLGLKFLLKTQ